MLGLNMVLIQKTLSFHGLFEGAEWKFIYTLSVCRCLKTMMKGNLFLKQHAVKTGICNLIRDYLITKPYDTLIQKYPLD